MKYWYHWNIKAEKKSQYTYQVENFENEFPKLLEIGKFDIDSNYKNSIGKKVNTRKHISLSWEDLKKEDEKLCNDIIELAIKYNYEI